MQKTWTNFKIHVRQAHQQLWETTNLQVRDLAYHANAVREFINKVWSELQNENPPQPEFLDLQSLTSTSNTSAASSISALQSEVASLHDFLHNAQHHQSPYSMPPSYAPSLYLSPSWPAPPYFMPHPTPPPFAQRITQPSNQQPPPPTDLRKKTSHAILLDPWWMLPPWQ